jgi:hypothetical protein
MRLLVSQWQRTMYTGRVGAEVRRALEPPSRRAQQNIQQDRLTNRPGVGYDCSPSLNTVELPRSWGLRLGAETRYTSVMLPLASRESAQSELLAALQKADETTTRWCVSTYCS